jgi:hypothetical protein
VNVLVPATARERDMLILVHVAGGHRSLWETAAVNAARELFALVGAERAGDISEPGTRVALQFDVLDFSEELKAAAVAAFEGEWGLLVPAWKERRRPQEQEVPRG